MKITAPQTRLTLILLACAALLLSACGDSAERMRERQIQAIAAGLDDANQQMHAGAIDEAVQTLEALDEAYPNEPEILEALAFAYAEQPDPGLAAFYFETLHDLQPERSDFALYAASAHAADGNPQAAALNYAAYLSAHPDDAATHRALADIHSRLNRHRDALESLLAAIRVEGDRPNARDAARAGSLYRTLGNQAQAEHWYRRALQAEAHGDGHRTARMGMLHIAIRNADWEAAGSWMTELDAHHPGAVDTSELAAVRRQLAEYREAREELARQREEARRRQEEARREAERMARAETEAAADESAPIETQPPAPALTADHDVDTGKGRPPEPLYADSDPPAASPSTEVSPPALPRPQGLLEQGKAAYADGDYSQAMRLFQSALTENPASAETAYNLSRTYYQQARWSEAELLGAEAVRMDSQNLVYVLNYLRAVQRAQPADRFIRELHQAQQQFPGSPDLTLALGRAYHHLQGNTRNASILYRQFLEMAPNHPRAEEIRATLQNL